MRVTEKDMNNTGRKGISIDSDEDKNTRQEQGKYKARKDTRSGKHKTKAWNQKKKTPRQEGNRRAFMYKKWRLCQGVILVRQPIITQDQDQ